MTGGPGPSTLSTWPSVRSRRAPGRCGGPRCRSSCTGSGTALAYGLAAVASGFAVVITLFEPNSGEGWAAFIALLAVAAPIVPPRQRTTAFGLGAAFAATWTSGAPWLAFTVGAAVLVAVAEDRQDVAWRGWAYGFAGAILSL